MKVEGLGTVLRGDARAVRTEGPSQQTAAPIRPEKTGVALFE